MFKSDDVRDWRVFNYEYAITIDHCDLNKIEERVKILYGQRIMDVYNKYEMIDIVIIVKYDWLVHTYAYLAYEQGDILVGLLTEYKECIGR